jgi:hypothetical protein
LELDLRSPKNWTWFYQMVKTAEEEVRLWQEKEREEAKQERSRRKGTGSCKTA